MAVLTYLDIVNTAIAECKVTLDPLTSVNFAAPPRTVLYTRFKDWVNQSLFELMEDRPEWYFRNERATVSIYPRLHMTRIFSPLVLAPGDTLQGNSSGVQVQVVAVHTSEEVENNSSEIESTISVLFLNESLPENLIFAETFDRLTPTADPDICLFQGIGRYDFKELVIGLEDIDKDTVRLNQTEAGIIADGALFTNNSSPIFNVEWDKWPNDYEIYPWAGQFPRYISETPQGSYALFPMPEEEMLLSFDYRRKVTEMVDYDDTPEGLPEQYHSYLVWRTVQEFADWDNNSRLYARATKRVEKYLMWLGRDQLPDIKVAGWGVRKRG